MPLRYLAFLLSRLFWKKFHCATNPLIPVLQFIITVVAIALAALIAWNVFWLLILAVIWTVHGLGVVFERVAGFCRRHLA